MIPTYSPADFSVDNTVASTPALFLRNWANLWTAITEVTARKSVLAPLTFDRLWGLMQVRGDLPRWQCFAFSLQMCDPHHSIPCRGAPMSSHNHEDACGIAHFKAR